MKLLCSSWAIIMCFFALNHHYLCFYSKINTVICLCSSSVNCTAFPFLCKCQKKRDSDSFKVKLFLKGSYEIILKDNEKMKSRQLNKRGNILLLYRMTFLLKHHFHSLFSLFFCSNFKHFL